MPQSIVVCFVVADIVDISSSASSTKRHTTPPTVTDLHSESCIKLMLWRLVVAAVPRRSSLDSPLGPPTPITSYGFQVIRSGRPVYFVHSGRVDTGQECCTTGRARDRQIVEPVEPDRVSVG